MRSVRLVGLGLSIALHAAALGATPFDGAYDRSHDACRKEFSDTRTIIEGNSQQVWEGHCTLSNPTRIRDMPYAILYDANCSQEGTRYYSRTLIFTLGAGNPDLGVLSNGYLSLYYRCPFGTTMY